MREWTFPRIIDRRWSSAGWTLFSKGAHGGVPSFGGPKYSMQGLSTPWPRHYTVVPISEHKPSLFKWSQYVQEAEVAE
jgi:hypothetical protein